MPVVDLVFCIFDVDCDMGNSVCEIAKSSFFEHDLGHIFRKLLIPLVL